LTTLAPTTNKGETLNPEQRARENIDRLLTAAGWAVQGIAAVNPACH
jgi:type I site-specific restriction endonuclease